MPALGQQFASRGVANAVPEHRNAEAVLAAIFRDDLQVEAVSPETDLFKTGILDSLKIVEMLVCLETRLGVRINQGDLEIENFRSPAAIAAFVRTSLQQVADEQSRQ